VKQDFFNQKRLEYVLILYFIHFGKNNCFFVYTLKNKTSLNGCVNSAFKMKKIIPFLILIFCFSGYSQKVEKHEVFVDSMTEIGQREKLIPYLEKQIKIKTKKVFAHKCLGYLYSQDDKLDLAENNFRQALLSNPKCGTCFVSIARIYSRKKDLKTALEYINKGINAEPNNGNLYVNRAAYMLMTNNKAAALNDFNKAVEIEPKATALYIARAKFNSNENYLSLAMADYNKAIELEPKIYSHYLDRVEVFFKQRKIKEANLDIEKAIELDPKQETSYTARGILFSNEGDFEKAVTNFTKAIELNPKSLFAYHNRSKARYRLENMDGSCNDLTESLKLANKSNLENPILSEIQISIADYCDDTKPSYYFQRGIAYYNLKKFDQSIAIYTKGLEKFPVNSMSLSFRGNSYFESTQYEKAIADYTNSIENKDNLIVDMQKNPNYALMQKSDVDKYVNATVATNYLMMAESKFALQKYDEALLEIEKAIQTAPELKEFGLENYYNIRGTILMALGENQKAIADFDKCLQLKMAMPIALINKAIAKTNLNNIYKVTSHTVSGAYNSHFFITNWVLPVVVKYHKSDGNLTSALQDCNQAIKEDPDFGYAYFIRGEIKRLLKYDDYCVDFKKAKTLDYPIEASVLDKCK
jgi:tetratricopeptide (TPR) repeat protein